MFFITISWSYFLFWKSKKIFFQLNESCMYTALMVTLSNYPNFSIALYFIFENECFITWSSGISTIITSTLARLQILNFLLNFTYFFKKLSLQPNIIFLWLLTEKVNRIFAFYPFLNITVFNISFKESIKISCGVIQNKHHQQNDNFWPPLPMLHLISFSRNSFPLR